MDNFIIRNKSGLFCQPGGFSIDPNRKSEKAVISHAHADHAIPSNTEVWCTYETKAIMEARYGDKLRSKFHIIPYNQTFMINDVKIMFVPAGHILGSAQVVMDYNSTRYCYTGDFKVKADESCQGFELVECDVLITETTFADPAYSHPEDDTEISKLLEYNNHNIVIGAYSVGKAQRINKLINKYLPQRSVMVHPETAIYHRVYEDSGMKPGIWTHYNYQKFRSAHSHVLIVPPRVMSTYNSTPGIVTTFATGWLNPPIKSHFKFHISDHADWNDIIWLVEKSGASKVLTVHGDGRVLKQHLKISRPDINISSL
jgi:putative mRNA 3-end processing factor